MLPEQDMNPETLKKKTWLSKNETFLCVTMLKGKWDLENIYNRDTKQSTIILQINKTNSTLNLWKKNRSTSQGK